MRFFVFAVLALSFVTLSGAQEAFAASKDFKKWLRELRTEAARKGISNKIIDVALPETMLPIPRVLELDRKQPEGTSTLDSYLQKVVTADRVKQGREKARSYKSLLRKVEEAYKVDSSVIVALWGIETSYGRNTGGYDVVNALATLAYDGRRGEFFRSELLSALKILDEGHTHPRSMKGSWAGAMGQSQFMPSSFLRFAVDFNNDGRRDIWETEADVFASAANYLASSGWKKGAPCAREVKLPRSFNAGPLGVDSERTLQYWHDKGVRLANGKPVPYEGENHAAIVQPNGAGTPAYLVYENYKTIMKWNKSTYFATAVCTLSDKVR